MRVTEAQMFKRITADHGRARARLEKVSSQLMSGRKIERPSDDPLFAQRVSRAERQLAQTGRYRNNISRVQVFHEIADTTVGNVVSVLEEMSTIAIQMANDSNDASARAAAASNVAQMLDQLEGLANTKHDGRHLFAGRNQDKPAYQDGIFQGDPIGRTVAIGEGVQLKADLPGPGVFGPDGMSAFTAAEELVTALKNNDGDAIAEAMESLGAAHETAIAAHTRVGHRLSELDSMDLLHSENEFTYKVQAAELMGVDIAEAASELAFAETTYQASIDTARKVLQILSLETQL